MGYWVHVAHTHQHTVLGSADSHIGRILIVSITLTCDKTITFSAVQNHHPRWLCAKDYRHFAAQIRNLVRARIPRRSEKEPECACVDQRNWYGYTLALLYLKEKKGECSCLNAPGRKQTSEITKNPPNVMQ